MSTKDTLLQLAKDARRIEPVDSDELGETVYVRELTCAEFDDFVRHQQAMRGDDKISRPQMVGRCLCDEDGAPMFNNGEAVAMDALPRRVFSELWPTVARLNGLGEEQEKVGND